MYVKKPLIRLLLAPVTLLYGTVVWFRNQLFDFKIIPSVAYPVPVICVGNIAVGGTGKTPFTEYLITLLKQQHRVATLSRGYKRNTQGFKIVEADSTALEAGDEASQMKRKFPDITVAVDGNRRRGIRRLLDLPANERPDVILLDDGMQHRYVKPSLTIMLTDYHNIYYEDELLPMGSLRETRKGAYRADIIIITKCEDAIKPIDLRIIEKNMMLTANQNLYLTKIKYGHLEPLFPVSESQSRSLDELSAGDEIMLITGIANPQPLIDKIKSLAPCVRPFIFPDHHYFTSSEIEKMDTAFREMTSENRRIITTEKDAERLKSNENLPQQWKPFLYYLPIAVEFLFEQGKDFDSRIVKHVVSAININNKNVKN
jgi:tetraacyldisaccharide 4'-kinase